MITVELDIFSGNPNPVWTLTKQEEKELIDRVIAEPYLTAPPKVAGGLGYRGYTISTSEDTARILSARGLPQKFYLSGKESNDAGIALLKTIGADNKVPDDVLQVAKETILETNALWSRYWEDIAQSGKAVIAPSPTPVVYEANEQLLLPEYPEPSVMPYPRDMETIEANPAEPVSGPSAPPESAFACGSIANFSNTNFSFWNNSYSISRNNCYNYASAYRSHTFAQPGRKTGHKWTSLAACGNYAGSVGTGASWDGYQTVCWPYFEVYGALVIWPNYDFHWYRYNTGGRWGHKPGGTAARNYDNSGNLITNPQTCNRGGYTQFCGYRYFPYGWTVN